MKISDLFVKCLENEGVRYVFGLPGEENGYEVKLTTMQDDYEADTEVDRHRWADVVFLQTPVNWMGVPWSFKR